MNRIMQSRLSLALPALIALLPAPALGIDTNINNYVATKLDDFSATMQVVSVNERELGKISRDAVLLYKMKTLQMRYKAPNMVHMEANLEGAKAVFVFNDTKQSVQVPKLGIK